MVKRMSEPEVREAAALYLRDRREVRTRVAKTVSDARHEAVKLGVRVLFTKWRAESWRGFTHGTRWRLVWADDYGFGRRDCVPSKPTPANLRREAARLLSFSRQPIRPSYCGHEDAEGEMRDHASELARVLKYAAHLAETL